MANERERAPQQGGSATQLQTETSVQPILHLRGDEVDGKDKKKKKAKPQVRWNDDVIDNEHMNKKKLKICCIFHPNTDFDDDHHCEHELSSSLDSSDESDGGEGKPNAYERQPKYPNQLNAAGLND